MVDAPAPPRQVSMLVHREVMDRLDFGTRDWLESLFGSAAFTNFCTANIEIIQRDLIALNPAAMSSEDFTNLSKEMRLIWRFWTDLQRFAEDYTNRE